MVMRPSLVVNLLINISHSLDKHTVMGQLCHDTRKPMYLPETTSAGPINKHSCGKLETPLHHCSEREKYPKAELKGGSSGPHQVSQMRLIRAINY